METMNDNFDFYQMGYDARSMGRNNEDLNRVSASLTRKYGKFSSRLFEAGVYAYDNESLISDTYDSFDGIAEELNHSTRRK